MSLAARITKLLPKSVQRSIIQSLSTYPEMFGDLSNTSAGVNITTRNAENITAVFTCLRVRAETMATIRTLVYKIDGDKSILAVNHPAYKLVSTQPAEELNDYNFWYVQQVLEDTWGNSYTYIQRSDDGKPSEFIIWYPWEVEVLQDEKTRKVWYKHPSKRKPIPARDVLHFFQNSKNGITGRSIISLNKETLGLAKKHENYAATVFGEKPPAVFEGETTVTGDQALQISKTFKEHVAKGLTPWIMGAKYKSVLLPPGDAEFIESRQFTKSDIYGMFRIPPYKLQNYSREAGATYSNVEQQNISFVSDVVMPAARAKESECNMKLFLEREKGEYSVQFDLKELLRGDMKTEKEWTESMLTRGVINRNEARKRLGLNPVDDGDRFFIQAGFIPVDRVDDFLNKEKPKTDKGLQLNGHERN